MHSLIAALTVSEWLGFFDSTVSCLNDVHLDCSPRFLPTLHSVGWEENQNDWPCVLWRANMPGVWAASLVIVLELLVTWLLQLASPLLSDQACHYEELDWKTVCWRRDFCFRKHLQSGSAVWLVLCTWACLKECVRVQPSAFPKAFWRKRILCPRSRGQQKQDSQPWHGNIHNLSWPLRAHGHILCVFSSH